MIGDLEAEEIVLGFLEDFKCGTKADELAHYMCSTDEVRLWPRDVSAALERLRASGDAEREGESMWFYRITEQGLARLKAGRR
jgi:hypothetical protein